VSEPNATNVTPPDESAAEPQGESGPPADATIDSAAAESEATQAPAAATATEESEQLAKPGMMWYVLRVASNKEGQVRQALERKVKIENYDDVIGQILVPTLKEKRMKAGKARVFERNLYPGYVFVEMATEDDGSIAENVWFMVKETTGVGDFISSEGKPTAMQDHEVVKMLEASKKPEDTPELSGLDFKKGDRVKINDGSFESYEGTVDSVDTHKGMVTVLLTIFGRDTPVDVEYWQIEKN